LKEVWLSFLETTENVWDGGGSSSHLFFTDVGSPLKITVCPSATPFLALSSPFLATGFQPKVVIGLFQS
jgi:hypothetical protein